MSLEQLRVRASALPLLRECKRCFFDMVTYGIRRPGWKAEDAAVTAEDMREVAEVLRGNRPPLNHGCEWCRFRGMLRAPECSAEPGPVILPPR